MSCGTAGRAACAPDETAYLRFPKFHRLGHTVLLIAFLGLALTGLPLKYSHTEWARSLAAAMGGFSSTSFWHRVCALVTFACFFIYLYRLGVVFRKDRKRGDSLLGVLFGPDSPMPNFRDFKDFFAHVALVLLAGAEAVVRALGVPGEIRFLGRRRGHHHHRLDGAGALVPQRLLPLPAGRQP